MNNKYNAAMETSFVVKSYDLHRLSKSTALVYSLIKSYWRAGHTLYMSSANIGALLKMSSRTVQRAIGTLERKRLVIIDRRANRRIIREPLANESNGIVNLFNEIIDKNLKK